MSEKVFIDGASVTTKNAMYHEIKVKLDFPDFFGDNLDALWDCLTGFIGYVDITWINYSKSNPLEGYTKQVVSIFEEAAEEGYIKFSIIG